MDRKRKASPLDNVPEAKRAAPTTGRRGAAAAAPSTAPPAEAAAGAPVEATWEDIRERTGMSEVDVLSRKIAFKKATLPAKKVEEMVPVIKELKALGWHLLGARDSAALDAEQWKVHSTGLEAATAAREAEWAEQRAEGERALASAREATSASEAACTQLRADLEAAGDRVRAADERVATLTRQLEAAEAEGARLTAAVEERDGKIREAEGMVRQAQAYSAGLQTYNTSLQNDITAEKVKREELQREKAALQGQVAELGGLAKSNEKLLAMEQEQVRKLREEREAAGREVAVLRADLEGVRGERERLVADQAALRAELDKLRTAGGRSLETLEAEAEARATAEAQLVRQRTLMEALRSELALAREERACADSLAVSRGTQLEEYRAQAAELQESLADAERRVYEGELVRRRLHNTIQELKGNIRVFCRVRPHGGQDDGTAAAGAEGAAIAFPTTGDLLGRAVDITVPGNLSGQAPSTHQFAFDKVFGPSADQAAVFDEISELVQSALDGHKVCIFAYGQTGSGKTFTMLGDPERRGIIPRAMTQVFESSRKLATQGWEFSMQASMLEIYNEEYRDLLSRRKEPKTLKVVHDANGATSVSDLTLVDVSSSEGVAGLLERAMEKRSVGCTALNEQSSRSHMVFTLRIDGTNAGSALRVSGLLHLIDLAGSERVKDSGATGVRLKEAQAINKSLSALGDVIMALANKEAHIPFRNSKLTWLLQPSLGGDAKTLMFVNINPTRDFAPESLCSLRFAAKVNACEIGTARRNIRSA